VETRGLVEDLLNVDRGPRHNFVSRRTLSEISHPKQMKSVYYWVSFTYETLTYCLENGNIGKFFALRWPKICLTNTPLWIYCKKRFIGFD